MTVTASLCEPIIPNVIGWGKTVMCDKEGTCTVITILDKNNKVTSIKFYI